MGEARGYLVIKATGGRIPLDDVTPDMDGEIDFDIPVMRRPEPYPPPNQMADCDLCGSRYHELGFPDPAILAADICQSCLYAKGRAWPKGVSWRDESFLARATVVLRRLEREAHG